MNEAEIRSVQDERGDRFRSEALDWVTSRHSTITRAAREGSIDKHCLSIPDEVVAVMRQARAEIIELQTLVHKLAGSIRAKAVGRRMPPKPRGLQDSL